MDIALKSVEDIAAEIKRLRSRLATTEAKLAAAERLLFNLTPGGSEFHGSPVRCAQWAQDRLSCTGKIAVERNRLRARLAAAEGLAVEMEKIERVANAHLDNPIGVAQEYINVTVTLRQIAHNALRQYQEAGNG